MDALKASRRIWIPFLLAALCLVATTWSGTVVTWVLLLVALCLVLDGATMWFSRGGGLTQNRQ